VITPISDLAHTFPGQAVVSGFGGRLPVPLLPMATMVAPTVYSGLTTGCGEVGEMIRPASQPPKNTGNGAADAQWIAGGALGGVSIFMRVRE
jgi:hypothetical protein